MFLLHRSHQPLPPRYVLLLSVALFHIAHVAFAVQSKSFAGTGNTLTGRSQPSSSDKGKGKAQSSSSTNWGSGGQTLGRRLGQPANSAPRATGAGGASVPVPPSRGRTQQQAAQRERSPTPDFGVDDDEDIAYYSDD